MIAWDDSEYIRQAIATADHVERYGLTSWPGYVVRQQIVRPPLYVNTLAAAVLLAGKEHVVVAAGLIGGITMALFGGVVFWIARRLADDRIALAVTAAMLALPGVMRWFPTAHADPLLTVFLLLAAGLWCVVTERWSRVRVTMLGVAVGLALWSKATAPLFLALPAVFWMIRPRATRAGHRLVVLAGAAVVAGIVAAPWYIPHGDGAIYYARVSSGFALGPVGETAFGRAVEWVGFIATRGWGYGVLLVVLAGFIASVAGRGHDREARTAPAADYVPVLLLGAIPMLALAAISRVPPNTRHVLPGLVFLAFAAVTFALTRIDHSRIRQPLWTAAIAFVALQYIVTTFGAAPTVASALRQALGPAWLLRLAPAAAENQPISLELAARVLDQARAQARAGRPRTWYLSGNSGLLNVSRLRMLADLQDVPVTFEWGSYFTWTPEQRAAARAGMRHSRCVVVLYEPATTPGTAAAELNRHNAELRAFVENPDNGFEPLRDLAVTVPGYSLSFYLQRGAIFWK